MLLIPEVSISGGTGTFVKQLLNVHSELKIETIVLLSESLAETNLIFYLEDLGVSWVLIPDRKPFQSIAYFSLVYEFTQYSSHIKAINPDLIVCSTGTLGLNFFPFFCSRPLVYILHSYPCKIKWWEWPVFQIPKVLSSPSRIIYTVSEYSKKMILNYWDVKEKNIYVIYSSTTLKTIGRKELKNKIVLTLGHVVDYKNPFKWIEIAKYITESHPDTEFVWLGEGQLLEQCILETSEYPRIRFMGYTPTPEKYYVDAYLYLQPSRIESFGLSVIEALSYGVPCIVSNAGGLPETVEDSFSGFICEDDEVEEYCSKITLLLNDGLLHQEMARNAYFCAQNRFNPERQKTKIETLYINTIKG